METNELKTAELLVDRIWRRAYLDSKEDHIKLIHEYASQLLDKVAEEATVKTIWHSGLSQGRFDETDETIVDKQSILKWKTKLP